MNGKIETQAFSMLFAVLLVSVMMMPVMAAEQVWQSQGNEQNVRYDLEKYTVRLVDSEIPKDLIGAKTQAAMSSFEEEFKNIQPRYIGAAEVDTSEDEKIVAYVFRVLPNGESISYAEVVSSKDNPSLEEISSHADAWIDGLLKNKTEESFKEGDIGLLSYGPTPIHTATISRTYTGVGRAYLTTTWYWDNQETNSNQDYFFTKTTLRTDPGIDISGYEPYRNAQFDVEIDSDYSVPGYYQHLPNVQVCQNNPQTTNGYTTVEFSLGTGGCALQWSTAIPDTHVELHNLGANTLYWHEEFSLFAGCAATTFEFTPGQHSYCSQPSARDGSTYVVSRVMADVSDGWLKIVDGIAYFAPSGTNSWGHLCKVKWSGGYVRT